MSKPPLDPLITAPDNNEYFNAISHLIGAILSMPSPLSPSRSTL